MPSRPDLRDLVANVKEAFADADRETLLDVLTFVVKEYVVEGPPPMLIHQAETLSDLQGASFSQLITALQTRFDHPELSMFVVDGEQVSVRVGGVVQPLIASRQPLSGAADLPRPQAGVRVVETTLQQRPPPPPQVASAPAAMPPPGQPPAPAAAPPPRGLSIRGQPSSAPGPQAPPAASPARAPQPAPGPGAPAAAPAAPPAPAASDKPEPSGGDDASARFSLLELD